MKVFSLFSLFVIVLIGTYVVNSQDVSTTARPAAVSTTGAGGGGTGIPNMDTGINTSSGAPSETTSPASGCNHKHKPKKHKNKRQVETATAESTKNFKRTNSLRANGTMTMNNNSTNSPGEVHRQTRSL